MNIKILAGVVITIAIVSLGIGFFSNAQKGTDTSILGTGVISDRAVEARPTEAPTPTQFIYLSPTPVTPSIVKFGERLSLKNGRYLTVFQPIVDYKQESSYPPPESGKKYVIVEAIYENQGEQKVTCDPYTSFRLIDKQNNSFESFGMRVKKPSLDCTQEMEDNAYIQSSKSLRGFLTFLINKDSEVVKVKYQSYQYSDEVFFSN